MFFKLLALGFVCGLIVCLFGKTGRTFGGKWFHAFVLANLVLYLLSVAVVTARYGLVVSDFARSVFSLLIILPYRALMESLFFFQPILSFGTLLGAAFSACTPRQQSATVEKRKWLSNSFYWLSLITVALGFIVVELRNRRDIPRIGATSVISDRLQNLQDVEVLENDASERTTIDEREGETVHRLVVRCILSRRSTNELLARYQWKAAEAGTITHSLARATDAELLFSYEFNQTFELNTKYKRGFALLDANNAILYCEASYRDTSIGGPAAYANGVE